VPRAFHTGKHRGYPVRALSVTADPQGLHRDCNRRASQSPLQRRGCRLLRLRRRHGRRLPRSDHGGRRTDDDLTAPLRAVPRSHGLLLWKHRSVGL